MKTNRRLQSPAFPGDVPVPSPRRRDRREREQGIAIITVLAVLLLMSVLVLAFFQMASTEYITSNNYDYGIRSRQAADTVISMVTGQIRKATTQTGKELEANAWISQPGAITTFGTTTEYRSAKDAARLKYKLYSSDKMVVDGDENLSEDVPGNWDEHPENWVDLNAPVVEEIPGGQTALHFPIIDPRAANGASYNTSLGITGTGDVAGFAYTSRTSSGTTVPGVVSGGDNARLPMPVRWLYMLGDGTIGFLDDAGEFVRSYGDGEISKENPVTQRFAFWTDDETSKLNINTASEGQVWDFPATGSDNDKTEFASRPPVANEFQRFPGQPARTSLSVVLDPKSDIVDTDTMRKIYEAAPKVQWGGTQNGTKSGGTVTLDQDRLYATPEEYLFETDRDLNKIYSGNAEQSLERSGFFLTASSSAPETTLFGTPRISMWGLADDPARRNAFDHYLAYCSTLPKAGLPNAKPYFFRRDDATSRHNEIYGTKRGPLAGTNIDLLQKYFYSLTGPRSFIPGYGGTFDAKYGGGPYGDRRQICTEAFDYIRNINVAGNYYGGSTATRAFGQTASCCICGGSQPHETVWPAQRQAHPKGFGRMHTLSEASLVFITSGERTANGQKGDARNYRYLAQNTRRVQAALVLELFCPSHGYTGIMPNVRLQVTDGTGGLNVSDASSTVPPKIEVANAAPPANWYVQNRNQAPRALGYVNANLVGRHTWGGTAGIRSFLTDNTGETGRGKGLSWQATETGVEGTVEVDGHIIISTNETVMKMQQTTFRIILFDDANSNSTGNLIQVFDVVFPTADIPVPMYSDAASDTWQERVDASLVKNGEDALIKGGNSEVVRSMVVSHGDYRLVSARRVVKRLGGGDAFQPHPLYMDSSKNHAHALVRDDGSPVKEATFAPMVQSVKYGTNIQPDFPMSPNEPNYNTFAKASDPYIAAGMDDPTISGDFDTGLGIGPDGAYINRPDEGSGKPNGDAYYKHEAMATTTNVPITSLTPNRLISGPVQFGSLSTGVQSNVPWRTLLFRPDPMHFGAKHADQSGNLLPPDHLFLDLFWMPVVQPYAISAPFATAGKINLNCQIAPFDYIKRQTALFGLLKAERVTAIPNGDGERYKDLSRAGSNYLTEIDPSGTLLQFEHRFDRGELFRSGSEICEIHLVPKDQVAIGEPTLTQTPGGDSTYVYKSMEKYWKDHALTGDNLRERPYASIYPRVTTKSNTFKVHMIVQHLKKARSSDQKTFDPEKDRITSQWQGSAVLERNIDPNDARIPSYYTTEIDGPIASKVSLEYFYNYRVLNVKQFAP